MTDNRILHKVHSLNEWVFVYGLPVNKAQFLSAISKGDFCRRLSYDDYENLILSKFNKYIEPFEKIGLKIIRYASSRQYTDCLRRESAVILYTHCGNNSFLEFSDGLVEFGTLAKKVDVAFRGIAEVCACAPIDLHKYLKEKAPNSTIVTAHYELSADLWIAYYAKMFLEIAKQPLSYWDACLLARDYLMSIGIKTLKTDHTEINVV